MGKGDKKTKKGKITLGTFGVKRRKKATPAYVGKKSKKADPAEPVVKDEAPKKAAAKPKAKKAEKKKD